MNRIEFEKNLGRYVKLRLFDGSEIEGYLRKCGDKAFENDGSLYLIRNSYFLTHSKNGTDVASCIFKVSHVNNMRTVK